MYDLAHNKTSIQSSNWSYEYVAGKAVDGNYDTFSWTASSENYAYWSVDLGMNAYVDHLYITNIYDSNGKLYFLHTKNLKNWYQTGGDW